MEKKKNVKNVRIEKNPYSNRSKKPITININEETIGYFKKKSEKTGIPYQTLINLYLSDCVDNKRELKFTWE